MTQPAVLDERMRTAVIQLIIGLMLFSSVESAVDVGEQSHHDASPEHAIHHGPDHAPEHDGTDCSHFCHCAAHLPSIAVSAATMDLAQANAPCIEIAANKYSSRLTAPPLRPPIS
jgi:hypothetical protein